MLEKLPKPTFEESFDLINSLLEKRKYKWQLKAVVWMDWEDVKQIILIHINKKWNLYDSKLPLGPWVNKIISHQISNLIRNHWGANAKPCLQCSCNEGNDLCSIYQKQTNECPVYAKWEKTKKRANDVKLPVSITQHEQEIFDRPDESIDISKSVEDVHNKMKKVLKRSEWEIYECLYIKNLSEEETAKILKFKSSENRSPGYARFIQVKKIIFKKAKEIIKDIDFI